MQITFVFSSLPYKGSLAQEGLDALLMGSAFAQCSVVFIGDAVRQLVANQQPASIGHKPFTLGYGALREYGVTEILCSNEALQSADMDPSSLLIDVSTVSDADIRAHLDASDKVLHF